MYLSDGLDEAAACAVLDREASDADEPSRAEPASSLREEAIAALEGPRSCGAEPGAVPAAAAVSASRAVIVPSWLTSKRKNSATNASDHRVVYSFIITWPSPLASRTVNQSGRSSSRGLPVSRSERRPS